MGKAREKRPGDEVGSLQEKGKLGHVVQIRVCRLTLTWSLTSLMTKISASGRPLMSTQENARQMPRSWGEEGDGAILWLNVIIITLNSYPLIEVKLSTIRWLASNNSAVEHPGTTESLHISNSAESTGEHLIARRKTFHLEFPSSSSFRKFVSDLKLFIWSILWISQIAGSKRSLNRS